MLQRMMFGLLFCCVLIDQIGLGAVGRLPLNDNWKVKQVRGRNWYPAQVPGVVQSDLMRNDIIPDPFVGMNERAVQWVDKEDWVYETTFELGTELLEHDNLRLVFEGLDTYADVYLNDVKVIVADNMFRCWRTGCKDLLLPGENTLRVCFHSPIKRDLPKFMALDYEYPALNDQSENGGILNYKVSVFARKAGYNYGWDWGPRLVTMGIWRPVYLEYWNTMRLEDVHISTSEVSERSARIEVEIELDSLRSCLGRFQISNATSGLIYAERPVTITRGSNRFNQAFILKNPRLWWSNGLGSPTLYDFKVTVAVDGRVYDSRTVPVGIRSIRLVTDRDMNGRGSSFYFELNGEPVFMKGANYIPNDSFMPRVSKERYRDVVARAVDANMNMLRVWGGGIYEDDYFYELCDRNGILIWQDFMFACSLYPCDDQMAANIRAEAVDNVKRLRNHACIALWCGNNEMNEGWHCWGWKQRFTKLGLADKVLGEYNRVFLDILPSVVKEYDPKTDYRSSSPYSDLYPSERNDLSGDRHNWDVWHGQAPFAVYEQAVPRFMSEYGFQSFPQLSTVKRYNPDEKHWDIESDVMLAHQRHPRGNELIRIYMERNYREPKDFESFLYMSQLLQADGMRLAIEAHRRNMPYCMGTLYWQHNDCWPVASWSTSDYYGNWKAAHYRVRAGFEDVIVSLTRADDRLQLYLVSDLRQPLSGMINLRMLDLSGNLLRERFEKVGLGANTANRVLDIDYYDFIASNAPENVVLHTTFESGDIRVQSVNFLAPLRQVDLPPASLQTDISAFNGGFSICVSSDLFARGVYLSVDHEKPLFFSDNYFDLLPGEKKIVVVRTSMSEYEFRNRLRVISMCDAVD